MVLPTTNWHLPSTSTSIKSCATADFQHPLKEIKVESRNEDSVLWENRLNRSSDRYFQEPIFFYPNSYISLYLEKH